MNGIAGLRRLLFAAAILGLSGAGIQAVRAGDTFEIKVYCVPRADAVKVDGVLSEPAWAKAPLVGGFTFFGKGDKAVPPTFFRVVYDDRRLIFGVICEEPMASKPAPVPRMRDSHAVFHDECVEIFIDPGHTQSTYYQFAVNLAGSVYDSKGQDPAWSAPVEAATRIGKDAWTLEFAVPWSALGVRPTSGSIHGFNVCRDRYIGAKQWTNWARVIGGFHDPIRFGHAILDGRPEQVAALQNELRKGDRQGRLVVYTAEGVAGETYRAMAREAFRRIRGRFAEFARRVAREETNPQVRRAVEAVLARYKAEVDVLERSVGGGAVDARAWSRIDEKLSSIDAALEDAVWKARLEALLSGI